MRHPIIKQLAHFQGTTLAESQVTDSSLGEGLKDVWEVDVHKESKTKEALEDWL